MARAMTTPGARPAPARPANFDHRSIEPKWQQRWEADGLYEADVDASRPKYYALVMFPYTSGDLHLGHWWNFALADVHARYKRMQGFNVLFPPGFDAFGLPAEAAAIKSGTHPYVWTMENIRRMERQWRMMGGAYDWSKEVATCLPDYYRWNQWLFLKLLERGQAYRQKAPVNWCPNHGVLANEQVHNGRCWRCECLVTKRDLEQWFFRITDYAEDLLDFSETDYPERIISMQTNWIGRSEGVEFDLEVDAQPDVKISAFTTRIDTVFGMTYVVLAPEHPLVEHLTAPERRPEVQAYIERSRQATDIERMSTEREKTGVPIGSFAINPANGERLPIWIADYVLAQYGTGAIMAVPASDERDWEFARKYDLPIRVVVRPPDAPDDITADQLPGNRAYVEPGVMANSGQFNGLPNEDAWERIADWFEQRGVGRRRVNYRMRDWLISRQRYWGTPIPVVYCPTDGIVPIPEDQLPVLLPEDVEFSASAEGNPLASSVSFVNTTCPKCGGPARRETDTMDGFMDSSWYFVRYASPSFSEGPWDPAKVHYWLPVDQYMGGAEHAVMHLLYSRYFTRVLRDLGLIDFREPFLHLYNQGEVLGPDGKRMSKSRGNVVNPDDKVDEWGADTVRGWLAFLGPWDQGGPVNESALGAIRDLLRDALNLATAPAPSEPTGSADTELRRAIHTAIKGVGQDVEGFRFNTVISKLMILRNELKRLQPTGEVGAAAWDEAIRAFVLLAAPVFPHLAEEIWTEVLGLPYSVHQQRWPAYDEAALAQSEVRIIVQVNGRVRDQVTVDAGAAADQKMVEQAVLALPRVKQHIGDATIRKVIFVPGKLVNIVF